MASRSDNKDGSCREILSGRHKGKWRVQFSFADELGRKQRISRLFPNKSEGKSFLQELRHGARVEAANQRSEQTLALWFDWLVENDWPESLDEKTIATRLGRFNKYVRPVLGKTPLTKINPLTVRAYYRYLRDQGVGEATVHAIKANLVRVFNQAINPYSHVPMTHANPFRLDLKSATPRDAVALTPKEAIAALAADDLMPEKRAMLAVFLLGGLRLSEQMALTKEQLLFDQDLIYIDRAVKLKKDGGQYMGLPKGDKKRLAVMCPTLKKALLEITAEMKPDQVIWASAMENKPRQKKLVYATWRTIIKDAKLPDSMSPHDCRLTHINWIEKLMPEVSATTLKEHVGHAAVGVTEVNYTRPLTPAQDLLRGAIERVITPPIKLATAEASRIEELAPAV
ncbi:MAG TPA: tyrosine-type recombinase/integrase [Fimbriimonadaceae bacterium]|jgi:integrase